MDSIADIQFIAMLPVVKILFEIACKEYETNPKYHSKKIYEDEKLVGFWVYMDEPDGFRKIVEAHYIGTNRFTALRMYKEMTQGKNKLRAMVLKANVKVWKALLKMKFKIVKEIDNNYILERC